MLSMTTYLSQYCKSIQENHQMDIFQFSCSQGSCNQQGKSCMLWIVPQHTSLKLHSFCNKKINIYVKKRTLKFRFSLQNSTRQNFPKNYLSVNNY